MKDKKYLVIGLIIILVLGLGCIGNTSENVKEKSDKNVDIIYSSSKATSIESIKAKEGDMFLVITMEIKNNGYDKFSVHPMFFELISNNIRYNSDVANTFQLSDGMKGFELANGQSAKNRILFEVPSNISNIGDYQIRYEGFDIYNINYKPK